VSRALTIFVPHCSDLFTDHLPHGDGLIAHGFISRLARAGHRLHVVAQNVDLREPLGPNVSIHRIPLRLSGRIIWRAEYMWRLRRLFSELNRQIRFDLIHQLNPVFTGLSLSLAGSGVPMVLGTYVPRWPAPTETDRPPVSRLASRCASSFRDTISALQQWQADALVLTSPAATNRLPFAEGQRNKVYFLSHGIDANLFSPGPAARSSSDDRSPSILFFANIVKRKGIFTLIEAFPAVAENFPSVRLRIAGDGPDLLEVERQVARLSCASQVEFLGRQAREDVPALLRTCTIYCLPSFGEPYASTIIEAMSCGKPIVTTNSGGSPHLVSPEGGILFEAGDASALSRALCELLRDPARRAAMGQRNRKFVTSHMTWDHVIRELEFIYEQTLLKTPRRPHTYHRGAALLMDRSSRTHEQV
jgi:L-malate glycosyltransferase